MILNVVAVVPVPTFAKTRGKNAPGGWRTTVQCSCGWNGWDDKPHWPRSFILDSSAREEYARHAEETHSGDVWVFHDQHGTIR